MGFLVDFGFERFSILGGFGGFAVGGGGEFLLLYLFFGVLGLLWVVFLGVFKA